MATATNPLIVWQGESGTGEASIVHVHHRQYPDARAEGSTAKDAARQLVEQLTRSLEHTPTLERRETIERAIAEIRDFLARGPSSAMDLPEGVVATPDEGQGALPSDSPRVEPARMFDVSPFGETLAEAKTATLIRTDRLQVLRLVVPQGKTIPTHSTRGEITVHCLEGRVAFTTDGQTHELGPGHMLLVKAGRPHALEGLENASLLVTMALPTEG